MGAEDLDVAEERLEMLRRQVRLCSSPIDPILLLGHRKVVRMAHHICSTWYLRCIFSLTPRLWNPWATLTMRWRRPRWRRRPLRAAARHLSR